MNNICHICGRDIVSPVDPVCDCAEELESLRSANQAMTETAAENSRVHMELFNENHRLREALGDIATSVVWVENHAAAALVDKALRALQSK